MRAILIIAQIAILALLAIAGAQGDNRADSAYPVKPKTHLSL